MSTHHSKSVFFWFSPWNSHANIPGVAAGPAKVKKVSSSEELRKGYAEALDVEMGEWNLAFGISVDWMENQRWIGTFWLFILFACKSQGLV